MKYDKITAFVVVLIVVCTVSIDVTWKYFLERSARIQAHYALDNIQSCANQLLLSDDKGLLTNYRHISDSEIEKTLKICAGKSLITPTGDAFAFDLRSKDFVFDPSLDCFVAGGKKMTKDSECTLHKNPKKCEEALNLMYTGYDSSIYTNAWWQFDDSREFLEWKVLPDEHTGYNGITRGGVLIPHQIVIAQGIQEDELINRYSGFRVFLYAIAFISIIINLLLATRKNMLDEIKYGRRDTDAK